METTAQSVTPRFDGESQSNAARQTIAETEPRSLRTFTPSLAVIESSAGCYHYTADGRKLADFTSGVLVTNLGHYPRRWWERVLHYMQLDRPAGPESYLRGVPLNAYNGVTCLEAEANKRLLASLRGEPGGQRLEQVLWAASGSEAVQKSLWAALARDREADIILATRYGFHGKKGLSGAVTGSEKDRERDPRVRFIDFPRDACRSWQHRQRPLELTKHRMELESCYKAYGDRLCCLITEPYLGGGGSYHPQVEYLQLLQDFCRQHDLIFILDEVQSNFGRTGSLYAYTTYGIEPDIVVLGKGMGNGIPVNAAVGRSDVFASLDFGEASDTWSAHPLGCAAVLATLDEFENESVLERAQPLFDTIRESLLRLAELPSVAAVRGEGGVWGIECAPVGSRSSHEVAVDLVRQCYLGDDHGEGRGEGIHLLGPLAGNVVRIAPPLVMPPDEASHFFDLLYRLAG